MLSAFPALAPQHHGAHTVLTGLLDQSALYGVLAEIEALGLDLLEVRSSPRTANHQEQVTTAHRDGHGEGGRVRMPVSGKCRNANRMVPRELRARHARSRW